MNYTGIKYFSTVNGEGITNSIFVAGCDIHCKGCFNQKAWSHDSGKELTEEIIDEFLSKAEPSYIDGISILGGEPLSFKNCEGVKHIIEKCREKFGNDKKIWLWTGYYISDLKEIQQDVIQGCDYVVDGPFKDELFDINLKFRGSSNQTIWENKENKWIKSELNG